MPPIHPALVHYPIALITFSLIAEFIGYFWRSSGAKTAAWWSLVGALIGGIVAVAAGYIDFSRAMLTPDSESLVLMHMKVGWILAVGLVVLTIWHWRAGERIGAGYLTVASLAVLLTFFQAWFGGEIAYAHGAGAAAAGQGMVPVEQAQARTLPVRKFLNKIPGFASDSAAPKN